MADWSVPRLQPAGRERRAAGTLHARYVECEALLQREEGSGDSMGRSNRGAKGILRSSVVSVQSPAQLASAPAPWLQPAPPKACPKSSPPQASPLPPSPLSDPKSLCVPAEGSGLLWVSCMGGVMVDMPLPAVCTASVQRKGEWTFPAGK